MVLINEARGFFAHPNRATVLTLIGAADFNTLVTAYTHDDFACRADVVQDYPQGQQIGYLQDRLQERLLHPSDLDPATDNRGGSLISGTSDIWARMGGAALSVYTALRARHLHAHEVALAHWRAGSGQG